MTSATIVRSKSYPICSKCHLPLHQRFERPEPWLEHGPYLLSGDLGQLDLRDGNGNPYNVSGKSRVFLCRCGASSTKPFCDGQHSKIGFAAAEAAVGEQG